MNTDIDFGIIPGTKMDIYLTHNKHTGRYNACIWHQYTEPKHDAPIPSSETVNWAARDGDGSGDTAEEAFFAALGSLGEMRPPDYDWSEHREMEDG